MLLHFNYKREAMNLKLSFKKIRDIFCALQHFVGQSAPNWIVVGEKSWKTCSIFRFFQQWSRKFSFLGSRDEENSPSCLWFRKNSQFSRIFPLNSLKMWKNPLNFLKISEKSQESENFVWQQKTRGRRFLFDNREFLFANKTEKKSWKSKRKVKNYEEKNSIFLFCFHWLITKYFVIDILFTICSWLDFSSFFLLCVVFNFYFNLQ